MRLKSESELLDQAVRKDIIEEILSGENQARKAEAYRRYECYKDRTSYYVRNKLLMQFDPDTVQEMSYALSNISFVRKVVDKLAKVYKYGVTRVVADNESDTQAVQDAARILKFNTQMKKANAYFKLFKNCLFMVVPSKASLNDDEDQYTIETRPLAPYLYDVVEHYEQREKPVCVILSNYVTSGVNSAAIASPQSVLPAQIIPRANGPHNIGADVTGLAAGNGQDEAIADTPGDEDADEKRVFKFWSKNLHFVCYESGEYVEGTDRDNPIGEMPFVNISEDQDGSFWAVGGGDLIDGAVLCNSMITNINHIGVTQGYGQIVMTGENLPRNVRVGPNKAVLLNYKAQEGEAKPDFSFQSANPPLAELKMLVEMYVALLLSTNNLSTTGVSSQLNGASAFPSGVAMLLDMAESMEDIEDQRQVFQDAEPVIWKLFAKWHDLYSDQGLLIEPLQILKFPKDPNVSVRFADAAPIMSETERLSVLKQRKELGLDTLLDLIKKDQPYLNNEEAEAHLAKILEERMSRAVNPAEAPNGEGNEDDSRGQPDNVDDRPGATSGGE